MNLVRTTTCKMRTTLTVGRTKPQELTCQVLLHVPEGLQGLSPMQALPQRRELFHTGVALYDQGLKHMTRVAVLNAVPVPKPFLKYLT